MRTFTANNWAAHGCFADWGCVIAFLKQHLSTETPPPSGKFSPKKYAELLRKINSIAGTKEHPECTPIQPAPKQGLLKAFGGNLEFEDYRSRYWTDDQEEFLLGWQTMEDYKKQNAEKTAKAAATKRKREQKQKNGPDFKKQRVDTFKIYKLDQQGAATTLTQDNTVRDLWTSLKEEVLTQGNDAYGTIAIHMNDNGFLCEMLDNGNLVRNKNAEKALKDAKFYSDPKDAIQLYGDVVAVCEKLDAPPRAGARRERAQSAPSSKQVGVEKRMKQLAKTNSKPRRGNAPQKSQAKTIEVFPTERRHIQFAD